jgi:hypothetical protein
MYGRPPLGKSFLAVRQADQVRSCIRPLCAVHGPLAMREYAVGFQIMGSYCDARCVRRTVPTRSLTDLPSRHSCPFRWCDRVRSTNLHSARQHRGISTRLLLLSSSGCRHRCTTGGSAVILSSDQHGPDDPRHLGSVGHRGDLERAACQKIAQPRILG